ncbi:TonB-dependent receptor [Hirschia baltica]|uniref:TonB-dependent receptor plug n=1 Tax=Hirschia baltica (strain ATCC 49814 / DSM 5838 / IFAM 1418) TaxID=582402 RepID=C6XJ60_HIRBI|nr:TonB-dependent receptor [Hirschia baltica]ACT59155.1 TonB-dependent receptor plug [Hirschia baltica ATCC 49814]
MRKSIIASASVMAMALSSQAAIAQETTSAPEENVQESKNVLGTVVVTATKREQTLQDVPIAVSVVDSEEMLKAQIVDVMDLQSIVPSLRVGQLERAANTTFSIRGFGNGGNNVGIEPSVAVFIDGVFRTRSAGSLGDFPDVERVEVLRGPQSTLFGKNASAGVVSLVTKKPAFDWEGKIEGTYGNYNQAIAKAYVSGPISESLAFSLAGSVNTRDGYVNNLATGEDLNNRDRNMVRGQLLFEPSDDLSIRLIADYDKIDEICCYTPNYVNGPTSAVIEALGGEIPTNPYGYETFVDITPRSKVENSGVSAQADWDLGWATLTSISSVRNQESASDGDVDFTSAPLIASNINEWEIDTFTQELRLAGGSEKIDWLVGGFYYDESLDKNSNVTYGPGFAAYADALAGGLISSIEPLLGGAQFHEPGTGTFETFTQENQSYNIFGQVDWYATNKLTLTAGLGYVNDEKEVTASAVNNDLFSSIDFNALFTNPAVVTPDVFRALDLPELTGGLVPAQFDDLVFGTLFGAVVGQDATPANIGAWQAALVGGDPVAAAQFAAIQANTPATEQGVAANLRTSLAPSIAGGLAPLQFLPGFVALPNAFEDGTSSDSKLSYTVRAAYDATDNINVYASYGTGFKATSWNLTRDSSYTAANAAALGNAGLIPNNRGAGTRFASPEEVEIFEIGAKAVFDRGTVNIALFDQTIEGFQSTIFQGTGFVLANAGEQTTQGIEIDATYMPIDQLTLGFAGLVQNPEYVDFQNAPGIGGPTDLSGEQPAGIHTTSLSFSALFEEEISQGIMGFIRADYQYEDEIQIVDNVSADLMSREVKLLNASLGFSMDNGFEASFWGRNITNHEFSQSAFPTTAQAGSVNGYPNAPATYGITLRKRW